MEPNIIYHVDGAYEKLIENYESCIHDITLEEFLDHLDEVKPFFEGFIEEEPSLPWNYLEDKEREVLSEDCEAHYDYFRKSGEPEKAEIFDALYIICLGEDEED